MDMLLYLLRELSKDGYYLPNGPSILGYDADILGHRIEDLLAKFGCPVSSSPSGYAAHELAFVMLRLLLEANDRDGRVAVNLTGNGPEFSDIR